ncbi:HesA/MoeB/ThiF family protein [Pseudodesulfovibrio sediminis]|uniref:Thiazole biosynthesis protein ThiF n=1 Tax=Pseudodesulfovibrio sediminis TaxID=2810563 RepID=A0ABM8HYU1_9BACT|nr:ThiF family adenylyltransferase [Pseudodesulfovibrio sediminis]BCS87438.1 thiazole biosynthesis protein ThiF [Pseudodesulfovibrio sediminis]
MPLISEALLKCARPVSFPWGEDGLAVSDQDIAAIAADFSIPGHSVEAQALKNGIYPDRYSRNMTSISPKDQIQLLESKVALVGLGGLGGTLLEVLLRLGVGTIYAADGDTFEASNLNRQMLSTPANLNVHKADAALERASLINPSVTLKAHNEFLDQSTLPDFLDECDIAIDALGGLKTRLHLQQAAAYAKIPLVTGALAGWTGYVGVVQPGNIGPADIMGHDNAAEEELGCPCPAVTVIASLMATEIVKVLTQNSNTLEGKMLLVDLASSTFETIVL